ncbi:MAG: NTP transferase domain-containing protein [Deltaproteobacteria bacterium]|nr:NTP transferase domain-containing protein [Deltaproteobacteria bacterium]
MSSSYQAVILAAGRGSRLAAATQDWPKALLPIGPRSMVDPTETSFLRRQCELLRAAGVDQITLVIGYQRERILEVLPSWDLELEVVVNSTPEIQTSGSLHSFQLATRSRFGVLDGTKQTLLMDADIVYDRRVLERILIAPERSSLLVASAFDPGSEEVLVFGSIEAPRFIAKGLDAELAGGAPCLGEAVGIVKLAPLDHALTRRALDWILGDPDAPPGSLRRRGFGPARQGSEHEELTQRLMCYGRMSAIVFGPELAFMEVDSPDEYERCRKELYPRLLESEAKLARVGR